MQLANACLNDNFYKFICTFGYNNGGSKKRMGCMEAYKEVNGSIQERMKAYEMVRVDTLSMFKFFLSLHAFQM